MSHLPCNRLLYLLEDCDKEDKEIKSIILELDTNCDICVKYRRLNHNQLSLFAESFDDPLAVELKKFNTMVVSKWMDKIYIQVKYMFRDRIYIQVHY